jgi:hypothetical protein
MAKKSLMELYEAGELSETEEFILLRRAHDHHQKQQIAEIIRQQEMQEAKIVQLKRRNWLKVAACILLGIVGWRFLPVRTTTPITEEWVFEQAPPPVAPSGILLGMPQETLDTITSRFKEAYQQKKYADCILLEPKIATMDVQLRILLAYCYLKTGNYQQSIALLEKLYALPTISKEEIRWWLGLSHGLAGDKPKMKQYLKEIAPKQLHYQQAQSLIR